MFSISSSTYQQQTKRSPVCSSSSSLSSPRLEIKTASPLLVEEDDSANACYRNQCLVIGKSIYQNSNTTSLSTTFNNSYFFVEDDECYYDLPQSNSYLCANIALTRRSKKPQHTPTHQNQKENRWNLINDLSKHHNNIDPTILDLTHKIELNVPETLRYGVTPDVALKIQELRISQLAIQDSCGWPHFLDVISTLFINLRHFITSEKCCNQTYIQFEQKRMLRLYILYRLPDLVSINHELVTEDERNLARPCTPVGVPVLMDEWCTGNMNEISADESDLSQEDEELHEEFCRDEIGVEISILEEEREDDDIMELTRAVLVQDIFRKPPQKFFPEEECYSSQQKVSVVTPTSTSSSLPPTHPNKGHFPRVAKEKRKKKSRRKNKIIYTTSSIIDDVVEESSSSEEDYSCDSTAFSEVISFSTDL